MSSLTETYRDAERGGGQRDGGLEGQTGRGQKNRGTQKIPFTQTEREAINAEKISKLATDYRRKHVAISLF